MVFSLEPQCSPFHYQEQMIEKMVKLEIFVQKMKDDMTALQQRVMDEIEILKVDKKLLKSDVETEKTSMNNAVQQVVKKNDDLMQNISSKFQEMVEADSEEMRKHAKEVEAIKGNLLLFNVIDELIRELVYR
jgi:glycerol-3-phosphate dehydrogenase